MASRALAALTLHVLVGGMAGRRAQEENEFPTSALKAVGTLIGAGTPYADPGAAPPKPVPLHHHVPGETHEPAAAGLSPQERILSNYPVFEERRGKDEFGASANYKFGVGKSRGPKPEGVKPLTDINAELENKKDDNKAAKIKYFRYWSEPKESPFGGARILSNYPVFEERRGKDEFGAAANYKFGKKKNNGPKPEGVRPAKTLWGFRGLGPTEGGPERPWSTPSATGPKEGGEERPRSTPSATGPTEGGEERPWSKPSWSR